MPETDRQWAASNAGPETLLLWLEPWAEEFEVAPRSTIVLTSPGGPERPVGEVEQTTDHLVVWASGPTVEVLIDDVQQASGSASIPIPDGLTKQMLNIVFAGQPAARLAGVTDHATSEASWWGRLKNRLGL